MAGCVLLQRGLILAFVIILILHHVDLSASQANKVLGRWRRAGSYLLEELFEGNLEKECYEEICIYEEAREVFENDVSTDVFWRQYWGGAPCISQPCLNNGSCQNHIRSYSCTCSPGYEGKNCAMAKNECYPERTDGCQHFCRPGQVSYMCSCAKGHKLGKDHKSCSPNDADERSEDPPIVRIRRTHVHMHYDEESGQNDVSLLELEQPLQCPSLGLPVCIPERDFAELVLIPRTEGLLSGWILNGTNLGTTPMMLPVTYIDGEECGQALNVTITTRTICEKSSTVGGKWVEGSVVTREHKGTWFLTGVLGSPPATEQAHTFLLTMVSRYLLWFKQIMK